MEQTDNSSAETGGLIQLRPVGIVKNQSRQASWGSQLQALTWQERAARMKEQCQAVSELIINPDLEGILDGINEFSHLMVLYWPHLLAEKKCLTMKVHPLECKDFPLVGTFATHSPARPNNILVTVVRLLEHNGHILRVTGLDALDGSPILDIKPYLSGWPDREDISMPDWMRKIHERFE